MKKRVLVVAAHPDDEILGCGGVVARMVRERWEAFLLILGEGITSRDETRDMRGREKELDSLKKSMARANKVIGVTDVVSYGFPDNRFDSVPILDIVKTVEKVKNRIRPEIIFTHYGKDLNTDHQITFKAVINAARPMAGETVKEIYSFEVLSSTEWGYPLSFSPDVYFDITATLPLKLKAMSAYASELKPFPHPRSLEAIELNAKAWGMKVGMSFAEAFRAVRILR